MSDEEKKLSIALPGEWALQKAFGPVLTEVGEDLKKLYAKGRDRLVSVAYRKIPNPDDGKQANLRVTRDVLWNGSFTEDEVCAEYFGGILASSRSDTGKDDDAIQFVDVIKSLSARQLHLHYVIYNCLNKLLVADGQPVNVAMGTQLGPKQVWFSVEELLVDLKLRFDTDLNILHRQGLLYQYRYDYHKLGKTRGFSYVSANPTTFGVLLYAAAHNKLDQWHSFPQEDFGNFPNIMLPTDYAATLDDLLKKVGLLETPPACAPAEET